MKKVTTRIVVITALIFVIGSGLFYYLVNNGLPMEGNMENATTTETKFHALAQETKSADRVEKEVGKENDSENNIPSEREFQYQIHYMTHQKVQANKKWGALRITDKQIDEMLQVLEKTDYQNHAFYLEVLTAWKEGDFTNAVDVHNQIWNKHNGTVGKAVGLMTEIEEQRYIEANFE